MLTLYKPWRKGRDLKAPEQTCKDAHEEYSYHQRFVDIQKYCKIRYECLDAQDDYRQSCKNDDTGAFFMHGQFAEDAEGTRNDEKQLDGHKPPDIPFDFTSNVADSSFKAEQMKRAMEDALLASNWQRVS
ncbi:hypothetical protein PENSPDRAFT_672781, partial [Peniophora sp. CONT]